MVNAFDMAREMGGLIDGGKSPDEACAEMRRMFPMATLADTERGLRIGLDRIEILEEELHARGHMVQRREPRCGGPGPG